MVYPFIKWAGGKRQLLPIIKKYYPFEQGITKYVEPFLGGGAVLFDVLNNFDIDEVYVNDVNPDLVNTYLVIRNHPKKLIKALENMDKMYKTLASDESRKNYYEIQRITFNCLKNVLSLPMASRIEKAAIFLFLNKTCFNGLYRVNSAGKFNVPFGCYKNPTICDKENILAASKKLKKVKIKCGSYNKLLNVIDENTFVFLDPPYRALNKTSSFNAYAKDSFGDKEQKELSEFIKKIDKAGALFVLCNSDPHNADPNDNFFDDMYADFTINRIPATRMINSDASKRGSINELLITNITI